MIQKVLRVGSSAAVTIPKKALAELGLKVGDEVVLSIDSEAKRFSVKARGAIDPKIVAWARGFMKKYRPALKALAK